MSIKLPKTIVFYAQSPDNSDFLLCWIPASSFAKVAKNHTALQKLKKWYPAGVEIEVDPVTLEKEGINLKIDCREIHRTYKELFKAKLLPKSRMLKESVLKRVTKPLNRGIRTSVMQKVMQKKDVSLESKFNKSELRSLHDLEKEPQMSKGEHAKDVFKRFSRQQAWEQSKRGR